MGLWRLRSPGVSKLTSFLADPQDVGAAKKISGEASLWLYQRGGSRQAKLGKVLLKFLVWWR